MHKEKKAYINLLMFCNLKYNLFRTEYIGTAKILAIK